MKWTLEVVVVPVSDVDRAKEFYADKVGFTVDSSWWCPTSWLPGPSCSGAGWRSPS
jgi:hypothetical protein